MIISQKIEFSEEREQYFSNGIQKIIENGKTGYLPAFFNSLINEKGIYFELDKFKEIMDSCDVIYNWKNLPNEFMVEIHYSPISFFKKWILTITNKPFLKISEYNSPKFFEKKYFFLFIEHQIYLFSVSNNLSHERFLYRLYFFESLKESNIVFNIFFNENKKFIIYKDYYKRKVSTIPFPGKNFTKKKLYQVKISVIKNEQTVHYLIHLNGQKINHQIRIKNIDNVFKVPKASFPILEDSSQVKKQENSVVLTDKPSLSDFRRDVIEVLKKNNLKDYETNKFANVSLGRLHSVPILINLSQKFKNVPIKLIFKEKEEFLQILVNDKVVKSFMVSFSPKSNWLERS